jgi:methionine aminotransferase
MIRLDSKLPRVGTTIFTVMSRLAEQHGAINLSQGFPDYQPPAELVAHVQAALNAGHNQYAPMIGVEILRNAIAEMLLARYGVQADPATQITITSGATEALFAAIHAVVRRDDDVIVFDPAYDSYEPAITLAGGRTIHLQLRAPSFAVNWEELQTALSPKTRLVIVNTPHNPSGSLWTRADQDRLAELLRPHRCFVLSDEVYEHIVFDGERHSSVLAHPELQERSFAVFSFGKSCHATGWKVGYCVAPPALTQEFRAVHQFMMFSTATPLQYGIAAHLMSAPQHYLTLGEFYQAKRDYFADLLTRSRLELLPTRGTYFQLADYGAISDLPDVEFARQLTEAHKVASIPVSVFSQNPDPSQRIVRFCFAKERTTLAAAAERLVGL